MSRIKKHLDDANKAMSGIVDTAIEEAKAFTAEAESVKQQLRDAFKEKRVIIDDIRMEIGDMKREVDEFKNSGNEGNASTQSGGGSDKTNPLANGNLVGTSGSGK